MSPGGIKPPGFSIKPNPCFVNSRVHGVVFFFNLEWLSCSHLKIYV
jgi:hypothetical protein